MNDRRQRGFGEPAIINPNGYKARYVAGVPHREGYLPAFEERDGSRHYYIRGELHRDDGEPARVHEDDAEEWWTHGRHQKSIW